MEIFINKERTMNTNTLLVHDTLTQGNNKKKRLLVTEAQMQKIFEHKLYTLMMQELEQKEEATAKRMSKEQLIKLMADRNHGEDVPVTALSKPTPKRKKIIQLTQDQLNRMILTVLQDNNAILHGKGDMDDIV